MDNDIFRSWFKEDTPVKRKRKPEISPVDSVHISPYLAFLKIWSTSIKINYLLMKKEKPIRKMVNKQCWELFLSKNNLTKSKLTIECNQKTGPI